MVSFTSISCTLLLLLPGRSGAFAPVLFSGTLRQPLSSPTTHTSNYERDSTTNLCAKKKGKGRKGGKGFGKAPPTPQTPPSTPDTGTPSNEELQTVGLSSITTDTSTPSPPQIKIDPNAPVEDRTQTILKERFGLRSFEEQQGDVRAAERKAETQKRMTKIRAMSDEEFDLFEVLPAWFTKGIDLFLKVGLTVTTVLFVLAGIGITIEAWAVSTKNVLPPAVDGFIVEVIEPNFTVGLGVLLAFSVSLGIFATAQLGSKGSQYRE